jgi:acetyltransferase-like isoleucine patch superfamily enzyme
MTGSGFRRPAWRRLRQRLADERRSRLLSAVTARALTPPPPSAFGSFGRSSIIVPPARILTPRAIHIGDDVTIHEHSVIYAVESDGRTPRLVIGDGCNFGRLCGIGCMGEVEIGDHVLASASVFISDSYHGYDDAMQSVIDQPMSEPEKVIVGSGSFLGLGAMILPGVTIGDQAYVGAGAVVTRDVPPRTLVVGNPARVVSSYDDSLGRWVKPAATA